MDGRMNRMNARHLIVIAALALLASGCMVKETRPLPILQATQAVEEIPEAQLLDIGIHLFDPGIPPEVEENEELAAKTRVFPEIRRAEARYLPTRLRDTLEGSGQWGAVRVVPGSVKTFDVTVDALIVESTGADLELKVRAVDATGRVWIDDRKYEGRADTRSYKQGLNASRDPFQNIYVAIAEDLLAARKALPGEALRDIRRVGELRFAQDFAPSAYGDYLVHDPRKGTWRAVRLPAEGDLLMERIGQIRERDYGMVDTVSENYASFSERISDPYTNWRRYTYDEILLEEKLKAQARNRIALGAIAVAAAVLVSDNCSSSDCARITNAARYGAGAGGVAAIMSGIKKREEAKIHTAAIKEISTSFETEAEPLVVDVEGRTLRLTGTAEEQYAEWRRLLQELYREETGLLPDASAAPQGTAKGAGDTGAG